MSTLTFLVTTNKNKTNRYYIHHSKANHFRNELLEGVRDGRYNSVHEIVDGRLIKLDYFNGAEHE